MLISPERAQEVFHSFDPAQTAPTLSPTYVVADGAKSLQLHPCFWLFEQGASQLLHGFHLSAIPSTGLFDVQSPYGYGGPLTNNRNPDFLHSAWQAWCAFCREAKVVCEFMRFHPVLENWRDYRGTVEFDRDTVVVDLAQPNLQASYSTRARGVLRKAAKANVSVTWVGVSEARILFPKIYHSTMQAVGAAPSYFFEQAYFDQLLELPEMSCAVCRNENGDLIGASLFLFGPALVEYHLSASTPDGRNLGASTTILHAAAQKGQSAGCSRLYLGGGTSRATDDRLLAFKASVSKLRRAFYIGRHVHNSDMYDNLKVHFADAFRRSPQRILFYR